MTIRELKNPLRLTEFGRWIREELLQPPALCVTNIDYVFECFSSKQCIMLMEEKQYFGAMGLGQSKTFAITDEMYRIGAPQLGYDYWGFYVIEFPRKIPSLGMRLNGQQITVEQFKDHCNFTKKFCAPWSWEDFDPSGAVLTRVTNRIISGYNED